MSIDPTKFLVRCSALGDTMTDPRGKSNKEKWQEATDKLNKYKADYAAITNKTTITAQKKLQQIEKLELQMPELEAHKDDIQLSATCKSRLRLMYLESKGRYYSIDNKFIKKGHEKEEEAITLVSKKLGKWLKKNEVRNNNDWFTGEHDLEELENNEVVHTLDTKACWTAKTFFSYVDDEEIDSGYWWQGQGYMDLTGARKHSIAYCLTNTPLYLVEKEIYFEGFNWPGQICPTWMKIQIIQNHVYDEATRDEYIKKIGCFADDEASKAIYLSFTPLTDDERVYIQSFEYDADEVQRAKQRVEACRKWMSSNKSFVF